ncbi:MAG TPA: helix-turn-helix transcriptional regulator [Clostridiales bacterium]|nr:helix-turn-helix transcriptional regulator [Clostridiales bacterium]
MYERYAALRDERKLTNYKVAMGTGITKSTFSDWKKGRSNPKTDKLMKIANYLGVSLEELVNEEVKTG